MIELVLDFYLNEKYFPSYYVDNRGHTGGQTANRQTDEWTDADKGNTLSALGRRSGKWL